MDITDPKFHLSPTAITQYHRCGMQRYYYLREGAMPGSIFLLAGKSSEEGLNEHYRTAIKDGQGLKTSDVRDLVVATWDRIRDEYILSPDDKPLETRDSTADTTANYHGHHARSVTPMHIQQKVSIKIKGDREIAEGVNVVGIPDIIDTNKKVIDWKNVFSLRSIPEDKSTGQRQAKFDHIVQISCYSIIYQKQNGIPLPELHYMHVKKPEYFIIPVQPNYQLFKTLYLQALRGHRDEIWHLNREHYLCNPKYCGYWDICHRENG